nr:hypothetical protein [Tanacetum cinerariifolium]
MEAGTTTTNLTARLHILNPGIMISDRIGGYDRSYQAEEEQPTNYALMAYTSSGCSSSSDSESLNELLESQVIDKVKTGLGYNIAAPTVENFVNQETRSNKGFHEVFLPLTGTFTPPKPDLMFIDEHVENEFLDVVSNITSSDVNTVELNHKSAKNMCKTIDSNAISTKVNTAMASINTAGASVNTVGANVDTAHRPVNTAASTPSVNHPKPKIIIKNRGYSHILKLHNRYSANKNNINNKIPQVVSDAKLPILNPNEFDLWKMRIELYFLMTDYSLWEVILNGDSPAPTRVIEGVVQPVAPTTVEQRLARKNELKALGTLLMALSDKHQLKSNIHKDVKTLMEAIEKRFGRNKETMKTDLEEQSLDGLFNSLKIYEAEVKSSSSASTSTQNIAFVSSNTDSTNEPVSVAASVSTISAKIPISSLPNVDTLRHEGILEQMGLLLWDLICLRWSATIATGKDTLQGSVDEEPSNYALMAFTSSSFDNE